MCVLLITLPPLHVYYHLVWFKQNFCIVHLIKCFFTFKKTFKKCFINASYIINYYCVLLILYNLQTLDARGLDSRGQSVTLGNVTEDQFLLVSANAEARSSDHNSSCVLNIDTGNWYGCSRKHIVHRRRAPHEVFLKKVFLSHFHLATNFQKLPSSYKNSRNTFWD